MKKENLKPGKEYLVQQDTEYGSAWIHADLSEDDGFWYDHVTGDRINTPKTVAPLPSKDQILTL